jgi:uncharacterized protein (TIGR00297 family)
MRWLSPSGTLAALLVGTAVLAGSGWAGLGLLFVFFLSSSWLTPGGGRRTAAQVAANGGAAAAAALMSRLDPLWITAFAGALAAAAADTWSTEIGGRSRTPPRLITSGRRVEAGTSGGVTWLGSAGGASGAAVVAAAAVLLGLTSLRAAPAVTAAGIMGGIADSVLGATLQARYRCPACGATLEKPHHGCGQPAILVRGIAWLNNDTVNLAATLVGAFFPVILTHIGLAWE